jgi:type IV secretion system protein VirD4
MKGIYLGDRLRSRSGTGDLGEVLRAGVEDRTLTTVNTVEFKGPEHILTIGPTRSGKGRRLLTPNLIFDTDRSVLVIDPKGELAQWTAAHRAERGSEVFALDPFGILANQPRLRLPSIGYNPMRWLNPESDDFVDDATAIAEAIVPVRNAREPHWDEAAQDLVAGLIMYHRIIKADGGSLAGIRAEFGRSDKEWRDLVLGDPDTGMTSKGEPSIILVAEEHDCAELERKLAPFGQLAPEDRELHGIVSSARTQTRFLGSPQIARDLSRPGIEFAAMRDRRMTVFLVVPPIRLVTHAKWLRLVISGAIEALRKTPQRPERPDILFMLDEFPQLGHMQAVETGVQLNAGYGIKFWIIVQNITQLQQHYRENWETFAAAGAVTAYAPRDPTTSKYLAELAGERTVEVPGYSVGPDGRPTRSINLQRRENLMPHEFRQMRRGRMFVRVPDDTIGEELCITQAQDFTELSGVPEPVKALGRGA